MLDGVSVFNRLEIRNNVGGNNLSKEHLDYLFSYPDNLEKSIYQYIETKSISNFLVDYIKDNCSAVGFPVYRGDCFYL